MNSAAEIKAQAGDVTAAKSIFNAAQGTAIDALAIAKAADSIGSATKTARSEGPSAITCIRNGTDRNSKRGVEMTHP